MSRGAVGQALAHILAASAFFIAKQYGQMLQVLAGLSVFLVGELIAIFIDRKRGISIVDSVGRILRWLVRFYVGLYLVVAVVFFFNDASVGALLDKILSPGALSAQRAFQFMSHGFALALILAWALHQARLYEFASTEREVLDLEGLLTASPALRVLKDTRDSRDDIVKASRASDYHALLDAALQKSTDVVTCSLLRRLRKSLGFLRREPVTYAAWVLVPRMASEKPARPVGPLEEYSSIARLEVLRARGWRNGDPVDLNGYRNHSVNAYDPRLNQDLIAHYRKRPGSERLKKALATLEGIPDAVSERVRRERQEDVVKSELVRVLRSEAPDSWPMNEIGKRSSLAGIVFSQEEAVLVNDVDADPYADPSVRGRLDPQHQINSLVAAPLVYEGFKLGVLVIAASSKRSFSTANLPWVQFAANSIATVLAIGAKHRILADSDAKGVAKLRLDTFPLHGNETSVGSESPAASPPTRLPDISTPPPDKTEGKVKE